MTCDAREREEVIAYYQVVIKDIADDKARFWRFLAAFAAITGALINMDTSKFSNDTKLLLVLAHSFVAVFTVLITVNTNQLLEKRRNIIKIFDERWKINTIIYPEVKDKERDMGNWLFSIMGFGAPALSIAIVIVHFLCRTDIAAFFATLLPLSAPQFHDR